MTRPAVASRRRGWWSEYAIFLALAIECLILAVAADSFFTARNLMNVLRQNAFTAVISAGMTFVILTGGIDLSVGSVVGLAGVLCADVMAHGHPVAAGVAAGIAAGALAGIVNGLVVTRLRMPAFVITLAMMMVARGAALKYTDARTIYGLPQSFASLSADAASVAAIAAVFGLSWVVLTRTPFGRYVYAVGGNAEAAWLSGVRVMRVTLWVYLLSGAAAGLAGVMAASRLHVGYPRAGEFAELDSIAAVVVGGTSLFGGRGSIWGTLAGVLFIGILNNGLNLYNVSPYDQMIAKGAVLAVAASLDRWRRSERSAAMA